MTELAFLRALRAALVSALALVDGRLEAALGPAPASSGPQCPECHTTQHIAQAGDLFVCGECEHTWGEDE